MGVRRLEAESSQFLEHSGKIFRNPYLDFYVSVVKQLAVMALLCSTIECLEKCRLQLCFKLFAFAREFRLGLRLVARDTNGRRRRWWRRGNSNSRNNDNLLAGGTTCATSNTRTVTGMFAGR